MTSPQHDLPPVIPIFPLTSAIVLPRAQLPLNIFEPRYLAMIRDAMAGARVIGMIQPMQEKIFGAEGTATPALYPVGCAARITQFAETGDGRFLITLTGICRFRIEQEFIAGTPYRQVRASYSEYAHDRAESASVSPTDRSNITQELQTFLDLQGLGADWKAIEKADSETLIHLLSMVLPFEPAEKQVLLEAPTLADRAQALLALMRFATRSAIESDPSTRH
jgi:uncharacterized protein